MALRDLTRRARGFLAGGEGFLAVQRRSSWLGRIGSWLGVSSSSEELTVDEYVRQLRQAKRAGTAGQGKVAQEALEQQASVMDQLSKAERAALEREGVEGVPEGRRGEVAERFGVPVSSVDEALWRFATLRSATAKMERMRRRGERAPQTQEEVADFISREQHSTPFPSSPSRNSLCPCGSGRRYKRCCMPSSQSAKVSAKM